MFDKKEKWQHPELLEGEVFFGNFTESYIDFHLKKQFGEGNVRVGRDASYEIDGSRVKNSKYFLPVFIPKKFCESLLRDDSVGERIQAVEAITKGKGNHGK